MLQATYINLHNPNLDGWYITDANGTIISGAQRHADRASCLRALGATGG